MMENEVSYINSNDDYNFNNGDDDDNSVLSTGAVIGISIGTAIVLSIFLIGIILMYRYISSKPIIPITNWTCNE